MPTISISVTQNFLKDKVIDTIFSKLVKISENRVVVDIGAGTGNITSWLVKNTRNRILAYELDKSLATILRERFVINGRVVTFNKNFLASDDIKEPYTVVSNIPFMITTPIMKRLMDDLLFEEGYIIMQKEAAYRYGGAQVNQPAGLISTLLDVDFSLEIIHRFDAKDFEPAPHITSVLLHIKRRPEGKDFKNRAAFADFVAYLFNKSIPEIRRAPILGRFLARKVDFALIPLMHKKPSELSRLDYEKLFSFCDFETLQKIEGYYETMQQQGESVQKINRTRNSENWRDMV